MHFSVTKESSARSSTTAVVEPGDGAVDVTALLARLVDGFQQADALRKRREKLKAQLPELSRKASKIAGQRDVIELVGQDADARIRQATAPLLAAKREIAEIPTKIKAIGHELRTEVERVRLAILDGLRSKYVTKVEKIPIGEIETLLRAARAEADALDPVLRRWGGYSVDFGWKPIDTTLRPAVLTGRWLDAVKHLQIFRQNLR